MTKIQEHAYAYLRPAGLRVRYHVLPCMHARTCVVPFQLFGVGPALSLGAPIKVAATHAVKAKCVRARTIRYSMYYVPCSCPASIAYIDATANSLV